MNRCALFLLLGFSLLPFQAQAGFEFAENGINVGNVPVASSSAQQKKIELIPAMATPARPMGAQRPPSDPSAPALTVFGERYVPDSIKKKYGLTSDWYARGSGVPVSTLSESDRTGPAEPGDLSASRTNVPDEFNFDNNAPLLPFPANQPDCIMVSDQPASPAAVPLTPTGKSPTYVTVDTWRARKGEPVRAVLKRWSERQGTELMWAAAEEPVLTRDFSLVGSLQQAVAGLLKEAGQTLYTQYRSDGMTPVMMSPVSTVTTDVIPPSQQPQVEQPLPGNPLDLTAQMGDPPPDAAVPVVASQDTSLMTPPMIPHEIPRGRETRWFALSGAALREVMVAWAEDEGAELIWQAGRDFALTNSVSQVGTFEDAVYRALSQFDEIEVNRPIGQIYADPATGRKVLVIKTEDAS